MNLHNIVESRAAAIIHLLESTKKVGETMSKELAVRRTAIHLLRRGKTAAEVAQEMRRSVSLVYNWRKRYFDAEVTGRRSRIAPNRSRAPAKEAA